MLRQTLGSNAAMVRVKSPQDFWVGILFIVFPASSQSRLRVRSLRVLQGPGTITIVEAFV